MLMSYDEWIKLPNSQLQWNSWDVKRRAGRQWLDERENEGSATVFWNFGTCWSYEDPSTLLTRNFEYDNLIINFLNIMETRSAY